MKATAFSRKMAGDQFGRARMANYPSLSVVASVVAGTLIIGRPNIRSRPWLCPLCAVLCHARPPRQLEGACRAYSTGFQATIAPTTSPFPHFSGPELRHIFCFVGGKKEKLIKLAELNESKFKKKTTQACRLAVDIEAHTNIYIYTLICIE
jgi:hypothetical protein